MKTKIVFLIGLCILHFGCFAQKDTLVRKVSDLSKLKASSANYIGKPLSTLLTDIGLPIRTATAIDRKDSTLAEGSFYFRFRSYKQIDSARRAGAQPIGLIVYVKEVFVWDAKTRYRTEDFSWKQEDTRRYGHLTVERIRVMSGND